MLIKNIPIGIDNFTKLVDPENNFLFVDKTEFIAKMIDDKSQSILITRPRRWGKTLNFSMLEHFFAKEVNGKPTKELFKGLKIESLGKGGYMKYQGQYPVISFTLKGIKPASLEQAHNAFRDVVCSLFREHRYLLSSPSLAPDEVRVIQRFIDEEIEPSDLNFSLKKLSGYLNKHTGQSVYIFIDEYDTPVMHAFECDSSGKTTGFLDDLVGFMKSFFTAGLKGNDYLQKGVMSGILRVSYHEMLSDLNNLENFGILNDDVFSSCYGFTEWEVKDLFERSDRFDSQATLDQTLATAKQYYNGYEINGVTLYNPWSIIHFLKKEKAIPYWVHTGSYALIKRHVMKGGEAIRKKFADLIEGQAIKEPVSEYIRFNRLGAGESGLWTVLLYAGYLKAQTSEQNGLITDCDLVIPNREIYYLYRDIFKEWLVESYTDEGYSSFMQSLANAEVATFIDQLNNYLTQSGSVRDFYEEGHYHTFVLGLACGLMHTHHVTSNRESGWGYVDMIIIPKKTDNHSAVIFEFKLVKLKKGTDEDKLSAIKKAAEEGLNQISIKRYESILQQYPHVNKGVKVGVGFCGKMAGACHQSIDLNNQDHSEVEWCLPNAREADD